VCAFGLGSFFIFPFCCEESIDQWPRDSLDVKSRRNPFGITREHGCLADVVQAEEQHGYAFQTDAAASVGRAAVAERVNVCFDFGNICRRTSEEQY
jgi:hypothetical protein